MKRYLAAIIVATSIASAAACRGGATATAAPTAADAKAFLDTVDATVTRLSLDANRAGSLGLSKPWPDALQALTGSREMDASAILDYFAPLQQWLEEQTKGQPLGW